MLLFDNELEFEQLSIENGELLLMNNFISPGESTSLMKRLINIIKWRQERIKMYGKEYLVPRETAWYGEKGKSYSYSGISCNPLPWSEELLDLRNRIESLLPGDTFNSVLLNRYRNGNDKVSWHSDDEKELGTNPTIASVSLGAARYFDLRAKNDKTKKLRLNLASGSLLVMRGPLQHHWEHQIPQQKIIVDERINLTFRKIEVL